MVLPNYPPLPDGADLQLSLNGAWRYAQPGREAEIGDDAVLHVPGEVVMQGLPYDRARPVVLERDIAVPSNWNGLRIRIRFEAVYSRCDLFVNGVRVGSHLGGFTPFDLDISEHVSAGSSVTLRVVAENDSIADLVGYATRYADHPLVGIARKAFLYALPERHIGSLGVSTLFDEGDYTRATLRLDVETHGTDDLMIALTDPDGRVRHFDPVAVAGQQRVDLPIDSPRLWHTESPALYRLTIGFGGQTYSCNVGFREVAVRDRQFRLNGRAIMLRGVNHHETHPLTGRADTARWAETDVRLLREANINMLRTSHYPPTIELAEACDRHGMLLEVEAPVCFAFGQFDKMDKWDDLPPATQQEADEYIHAASMEIVAFYRSHPSVVIWSVANESFWAPPFERSAAAIRQADPTRPTTFNWWQLQPDCRDHVGIANHHYPDAGQVATFETEPRPIIFDEFAHLYCYNDRELATDPGLRHLWGGFLERQWDEIRALPNGIGGSIWAAIDDWFAVPTADGGLRWSGYGEWGPIDGWRRKKPEYEEMKRVFDPLRATLDEDGKVWLENRFDFTDLSELSITWSTGERNGQVAPAGAPGDTAMLDVPAVVAGERIALTCELPQRSYRRRIELGVPAPVEETAFLAAPAHKQGGVVVLSGWTIATVPGALHLTPPGGDAFALSLAFIPRQISRVEGVRNEINPPPLPNETTGWTDGWLDAVEDAAMFEGQTPLADATITLRADAAGKLEISYAVRTKAEFEPFQTGLELLLPVGWHRLSWDCGGARSDFPDDHPARGSGQTLARRDDAWPDRGDHPLQPAWPWSLDQTAHGTNDFRSTKRGVRSVTLEGPDDGLNVAPLTPSDARAQLADEGTRLFLLDFSSHGSERFLESFAPHVQLRPGDTRSGKFKLKAL